MPSLSIRPTLGQTLEIKADLEQPSASKRPAEAKELRTRQHELMSLQNLMRAEYHGDSWHFIDPSNPANRVRFEQALIDPDWIAKDGLRVDGYVKSVYGIDAELAKLMDAWTLHSLGVVAFPKLSRSRGRVRLMPDGTLEDAELL